ncbi:alpha/beta hydrolase [Sphingomonas sp. 1P06PA]|uniref:alpha/beta fold hydrolase n=1 Tax=Sphingomonas sp. 1P06PA TaxID=554121 RepID=UPI0039A68168
MTPEPIRFRTRDGLWLAGEALGDRDAPRVIFVHGGGQTRGSWKDSLAATAALGRRAIAFDARGHGESDWSPTGDYSLSAFADDLGIVIAEAGGKPPVIVGASLGGIAALLHLGEGDGGAGSGLALVDVAPRINLTGVTRILAFMSSNPNGFASLDDAAAAIAAYNPDRRRPPSAQGLARSLRLRDGRYHWHWDPRFLQDRHAIRLAEAGRIEAAAAQIKIPTLLVHAGLSDIVTKAEIDHLASVIPHARYAHVADAGHMIAGDDNVAFNRAIGNFLEGLANCPPLVKASNR